MQSKVFLVTWLGKFCIQSTEVQAGILHADLCEFLYWSQ